jgi:membrane associated rhomboid family serine protease
MGLADRHYMRQPAGDWRWSATIALIVTLVVAFFAQYGILSRPFCYEYLTLSVDGLKHGYVWQLLTFQFLHAGLPHLIMNCLPLYLFGREVESILGKSRFLTLYFSSGVIGGLIQTLLAVIWPAHFAGAVVGASAGIFGITAAFSTLFPDQILTLLFLPIRFKARIALIISIVIGGIGLFVTPRPGNSFSNIAHAAHLGGILVGVLWVKLGWHHDYAQLPWEGWFGARKLFGRSRRKSDLVRATTIRIPGLPRSKSEDASDLPQEEFISRQVDPILDKISQHGIQSLTDHERKVLEAARNKMAKR